MMLAVLLGGETHVRTALAGEFVAELAQCLGQLLPGYIPGQFHRVSTSSRT